jgi:hypothetical protein
MRLRLPHLLLLLCLLLAAHCASADVVVLSGGETMSGSLVRVEEATLVFRTSLQGQLMVPMDSIEGLTTTNNYVVTLESDTVYYGRFDHDKEIHLLRPLDGSEPIPLKLAEVKEATLIPPTAHAEESAPDAKGDLWSGSASAGVLSRTGAADTVGPLLRIEGRRREGDNTVYGEAALEPGEDMEWLRARAGYRAGGGAPFDPLIEVGLERSQQEHLQLRAGLMLGLLYPAEIGETASLDALLGLELEHEDWEVQQLSAGSEDGDDLDLNLRLGLRYKTRWLREGSISSDLYLIPGLTDFGDFRARSESAVTWPLAQRLRLRLDLLLDYDNAPHQTNSNWNAGVGASVQLDF